MRRDLLYEQSFALPFQRRLDDGWLRDSTILYPPRRDPFLTPLLTSLGVTGSIAIGTTGSITYASIASAIITTAGSIALQMLMQKSPDVASGHVPKTEPVSYRSWIVGRTRVSGAYMLWESKGTHLFSVQAIAGHKIQSVNRYWLHSDEVELGPDNRTTNDDAGRYSNNVLILHRLGNNPETAYSELVDYLGASGVWTNTRIDRVVESLGGKLDTAIDSINKVGTQVQVLSSKLEDIQGKPEKSIFRTPIVRP